MFFIICYEDNKKYFPCVMLISGSMKHMSAQFVKDDPDLAALFKLHFQGFRLIASRPLNSGWTNRLYKCLVETPPGKRLRMVLREFSEPLCALVSVTLHREYMQWISVSFPGPLVMAYGQVDHIRLDHFIPGQPLLLAELMSRSVMSIGIQEVAKLHRVPVLGTLKPGLLDRVVKWGQLWQTLADPEASVHQAWIHAWLGRIQSEIAGWQSGIVICHSDLYCENMLQTPFGLRLIDFDYTLVAPLVWDLGNLCMNLKDGNAAPHYSETDFALHQTIVDLYISETNPDAPPLFRQTLLRETQEALRANHVLMWLWNRIMWQMTGQLRYLELSRWHQTILGPCE